MDDPGRPAGVLSYSFDKRLVEILRDSAIWGRIAIPVLMAFSSKYAVSLYENAAQWTNLSRKISQDLPLEEFRAVLGVEEGRYEACVHDDMVVRNRLEANQGRPRRSGEPLLPIYGEKGKVVSYELHGARQARSCRQPGRGLPSDQSARSRRAAARAPKPSSSSRPVAGSGIGATSRSERTYVGDRMFPRPVLFTAFV